MYVAALVLDAAGRRLLATRLFRCLPTWPRPGATTQTSSDLRPTASPHNPPKETN